MVDLKLEVRTSRDDTLPELRGEKSDWHNGYFIAALRRPASLRLWKYLTTCAIGDNSPMFAVPAVLAATLMSI